jgi:NADPH:quinone reductase-like Zn-dependent oxidoreductase
MQIAKAMGARVIAAASSDEKCEFLQGEMGADASINYVERNVRDALKALTGGKGPDVVYDPVGGDLAEPAFRSIAWRGRYLVIGFAAGRHPGAAAEPGAAQGRLDRRRVLGRLRPSRAQGQRQAWPTGAVVRRGQGQAGHRPGCRWRAAPPTRAWARARCRARWCWSTADGRVR